jgi:hypothetical protein
MSDRDTALEAMQVAIDLLRAVRNKLEAVIARKKFADEDVSDEREERARVNRKLGDLRDLQVELEAAQVVVSAPSVEEIAEARQLLQRVQELAVADAMIEAGVGLLRDAATAAASLRAKTKPG